MFKQILSFCQIRLHFFVVNGKNFACVNFQGVAVSGHRLGQIFIRLPTLNSYAECLVRATDVNKRRRPKLRITFPFHVIKRLLVTGKGLLKAIVVVAGVPGAP